MQGYGLSEAAPLVLLLDAQSALQNVGSAGRPPLLVDVRIVGADGIDAPPGETGELFLGHPAVADAGVASVAAADGGDVRVAFVVLVPGSRAESEELLAFASTRLAAHERPASVVFVDTLPRNSVGKLQREQLRSSLMGGATVG